MTIAHPVTGQPPQLPARRPGEQLWPLDPNYQWTPLTVDMLERLSAAIEAWTPEPGKRS